MRLTKNFHIEGVYKAVTNLIKKYEGFSQIAYRCPAGVWTIGYGFTWIDGKRVKQGDTITKEKSEELLKEKIDWYFSQILNLLKVDINEGQAVALISFTFNVGINALKNSTLLRLLNEGKPIKAKRSNLSSGAIEFYSDWYGVGFPVYQFHRWVNINGRWNGKGGSEGLAKRRAEELKYYLGEKLV